MAPPSCCGRISCCWASSRNACPSQSQASRPRGLARQDDLRVRVLNLELDVRRRVEVLVLALLAPLAFVAAAQELVCFSSAFSLSVALAILTLLPVWKHSVVAFESTTSAIALYVELSLMTWTRLARLDQHMTRMLGCERHCQSWIRIRRISP